MALTLDLGFPTIDDAQAITHDARRTSDAEPADHRRPKRHSLGTSSHKFLRSDDPVYYASLKKIFDAPEKLNKIVRESHEQDEAVTTPDLNASFDSLAKQTLDELFGDEDEAEAQAEAQVLSKRHSFGATSGSSKTSYDPHATHQLDLHEQLFRNRSSSAFQKGLLRKAESDGAAFVLKHAMAEQEQAPSSPDGVGGANWLSMLAQRKPTRPSILPDAAKPPHGWKPTIKTVFAVLKLRKLHAAKLAKTGVVPGAAAPVATGGSPPKPTLQRAPSSSPELPTLTATEVASSIPFVDEIPPVDESALSAEYGELFDPQSADFDVQAFYEECWTPYGYVMVPMAPGMQQQPQATAGEMAPMATGGAPPASVMASMPAMGMPMASQQPTPWATGAPVATAGFPYSAAVAFAPQPQAPTGWQPQAAPRVWGQAQAPVAASGVSSPVPTSPPQMAMGGALPAPWQLPASTPSSPPPPSNRGLVAMAQEQDGSRTLQQRLQMMGPQELASAIAELAPHLTHLSTNAFGNYLVSSLAALPAAHNALYSALQGHVARLMQHPQGSRVVQAALKKLPMVSKSSLVAELQGRVADVASGTHGSWSVVCAYEQSHAAFIVRELANDISRLSLQQNGSRVVQRVLAEAAAKGFDDLSAPLDALLRMGPARLVETADDKFGNYVVQLGLKHGTPQKVQQLVDCLLPALRRLATSKCGSNVAEVVVERAPTPQLLAFCGTITHAEAEQLRAQQYGAYVMNALDRRVAA